MFGAGFGDTRDGLVRHRALQRGDWTLYPWQVFRSVIEVERPAEIVVSERLFGTYQMLGQRKTRDRIARLYFQRRHLRLLERAGVDAGSKMALVTRKDLKRWQRAQPGIESRAIYDPSGQIVLIRPR